MLQPPTRRSGRPVGAVQTPRSMLTAEVRENIRLNRDMRELVTRLLKEVSEALAGGTLSFEAKLKVIGVLSEHLQAGATSAEKIGKHLLGDNESEAEARGDPESISDVIAALSGKEEGE